MQKQFKILSFIILWSVVQVYPQTVEEQKFLEMKNSFILGLTEKGFEIGAELMSRNEYVDVREDATFYIAEFFFTLASQIEVKIDYPNKAYTYYLVMQKEYPNSKYSNTVNKRINTLITFFQDNALFRNLFDLNQNEASFVAKKLEFTQTLYKFKFPNPYLVFSKGTDTTSTAEVLDRYYDEIIVNHPEFEIYASYYKIISKLSKYWGNDYISDGLFEYNSSVLAINSDEGLQLNETLNNDLDKLSLKYPHHPLTLELHLIFAKVFLDRNTYTEEINLETKKHLEYVIKNELDKTHPRYLLTREFLLNNKFK